MCYNYIRYNSSLVKQLLAALMAFTVSTSSNADPVTFNFVAEVSSLTAPSVFGINPSLGTEVSGFFTYETSTADSSSSPDRGNYEHAFGGAFQADISGFGTIIEGSATPFVQVENFATDTFRFIDGSSPFNQVTPDGVMSLNGVPNADVELFLAISDSSGTVFSNDALPDPFPITMPPNLPHTFSLGDGTETMLLQFTSITPIPEPTMIGLLLFGCALFGIGRRRP